MTGELWNRLSTSEFARSVGYHRLAASLSGQLGTAPRLAAPLFDPLRRPEPKLIPTDPRESSQPRLAL